MARTEGLPDRDEPRFLAATARCKQEAAHRSRRRCGIGLLRAATGFRNWPRTGASRSPAWRRRGVAARPANWRSPAAPRQQPPVAPALRRARGCAPPAAFPTRPTTQPPVHRGFSPSFESNEQTGRGRGVSALCAARSPHRQDRLPHAGPRTQVQHLSQTRIGRLRPNAALLTLTAVHGREQPRVDLPESISAESRPRAHYTFTSGTLSTESRGGAPPPLGPDGLRPPLLRFALPSPII